MRLGITVLDGAAAIGRWPDDNIAAIVSFGRASDLREGPPDSLGSPRRGQASARVLTDRAKQFARWQVRRQVQLHLAAVSSPNSSACSCESLVQPIERGSAV
jgi:hypothetical protein